MRSINSFFLPFTFFINAITLIVCIFAKINNMLYSIYAESTPNPEVMKFVANRMLADKSIEVSTVAEAHGISIAEELLKFPFVKSIYLNSNFISISKIMRRNYPVP